jgi:hypothetical protein
MIPALFCTLCHPCGATDSWPLARFTKRRDMQIIVEIIINDQLKGRAAAASK